MYEIIAIFAAVMLVSTLVVAVIRSNPLLFLVVNMFGRFALDAAPNITYASSYGGLSIVAMFSATIVFFGILFVLRSNTGFKLLWPIVLTLCASVLAGVLQGNWFEILYSITKWVYFLVIISITAYACRKYPSERLLTWISLAVALPLASQMYYWLLGIGKVALSDASISYIGTYSHENIITMVLYMAIPATLHFLLTEGKRKPYVKISAFLYLGVLLVGVSIANYRTMIVGIVFYIAIVISTYLYKIKPMLLPLLLLPAVMIALLSFTWFDYASIADRFSDIYEMVTNPGRFIKPPDRYSADDLLIMSGRPYLVSLYLDYYFKSSWEIILIGIGAGVGEKIFGVYAHNGYVSVLVETGVIGFMVFMYLIVSIVSISVRTFKYEFGYIYGALPLSILVIALGAMPFVDIVDLLVFGTYLGICISVGHLEKPAENRPEGTRNSKQMGR